MNGKRERGEAKEEKQKMNGQRERGEGEDEWTERKRRSKR